MARAPDVVPRRGRRRRRARAARLPARRPWLLAQLLRANRAAGRGGARDRPVRPARLRQVGPAGGHRVDAPGLPRRARGAAGAAGPRPHPPARHFLGRDAGDRACAERRGRPAQPRPQLDARERRRVGGGGRPAQGRAAGRRRRRPRAPRAGGHDRRPRVRRRDARLRGAAFLSRRRAAARARADGSRPGAGRLPRDVGRERVDGDRRPARLGRPAAPAGAPRADARDPRAPRPFDRGDLRTLVDGIPGARQAVLEHSSHTPVLEETDLYLEAVGGFLRDVEA